jgi:hypothetical protein
MYFCNMKFLAIILSAIVMTLTVVPCCVYDNCSEGKVHEENKNKPEIPCSPFVQCTCSVGICMAPVFTLDFFQEVQPVKKETQYLKSFTSNYLSSIWQPPKLAC